MMGAYRVGLLVPSSNTTMETEIPALLTGRQKTDPDTFTFHSSRMRMQQVRKEDLEAMNGQAARCAVEVADARVDVMAYACLVAIMATGKGYHRVAEGDLARVLDEYGHRPPIVTSASALVTGLNALGAKSVAMITPYMKPLTSLVCDYIKAEGIEVVDAISLEISDNLEVGRRDPMALPEIVERLKIAGADAIILSACVQMPSLAAIPHVEERTGFPVVSAAICTTFEILKSLGLQARAPFGGRLLAGAN